MKPFAGLVLRPHETAHYSEETSRMPKIERAQVVLPCRDVQACADFFVDDLDFRIDTVFPADDPRHIELSGHGLVLCLERSPSGPPAQLRFHVHGRSQPVALNAPNGTRIELLPANPTSAPVNKAPDGNHEPVLVRWQGEAPWVRGRAGMLYRDLVPGRLGNTIIASHIRIPEAGPVPDMVHFHQVDFQMIFCRRGWVRLVYEDQGEPFVLRAGGCVLQPPEIRHRVLESSEGLEVIEIALPAEHPTRIDHQLELPTPHLRPERKFGAQRFLHFQGHKAPSAGAPPSVCHDTGIHAATEGAFDLRIHELAAGAAMPRPEVVQAIRFYYVLDGHLAYGDSSTLGGQVLEPDSALTLTGEQKGPTNAGPEGCRLLELRVPRAHAAG